MNFIQSHLVQESPELAHKATVEAVVIFVLSMTYEIEVTMQQPWTTADRTQFVELGRKVGLSTSQEGP